MRNILIAVLISFALSCKAQVIKATLMEKNLILEHPDDSVVYKIRFTDKKIIAYTNNHLIGEVNYYMSDNSIDCGTDKFNQNKVGVSEIGKYVVSDHFCLKLTSLKGNKIKFYNLKLRTEQTYITE